jgi:hypothetical protein
MAASSEIAQVDPDPPAAAPRPEAAPAGDGAGRSETAGAGENLYLIGRPQLKSFLKFVKSHAVSPPGEGDLAEEWQAANDLVRRLEKEEAEAADDPPIDKLGPEYEPLLIELLDDPLVRHGFNTVPTDVALVELDRLVVYQKHIDLTYVRQLAGNLGPAPTREQIFRTCLLHDHPQPPMKWSRVGDNRFIFVSPSNDLRFLGALPMHAGHIKDVALPGQLAGVAGLTVGFGSNFLNAIYAEKRLILNNGSHRAYALREMGITHVPCIVQHVSSRDQVEVLASKEVRRDPELYLGRPRPPMLKDYFNPRLHRVMAVHRRLRQITVRFEIEENYVPAL